MSTHPKSPPGKHPSLCTAQHSILQQERLYLLRGLADEERRKERLTSTLRKVESALNLTTSEPYGHPKALGKKVRILRSKLNRCKRTSRALCTSLEDVVAQMERLDDHQWRRAHDDYAQQTQYGLMTSLSPTRPSAAMINLSAAGPSMQHLRTDAMPQSPFLNYQQQAIIQGIYANPMEQTLMSQIPATPILRPVQYSYSDGFSFSPPPRRGFSSILTNINPTSGLYSYDSTGPSPTDTISTYSLNPNPWVAGRTYPSESNAMPVSGIYSNVLVPTTQVFDLVQGLGTMGLSSGPENQNLGVAGISGVWVRAPPPQLSPLHSASMMSFGDVDMCMQGGYGFGHDATSKLQGRAGWKGKRRSA
ncbi:hypothetical protein LTR84_005321 [Exophiala bonariae]|uniref:BHLH domain-containing protein n=1 Tax=Exophiala bonariae TaxID=1690606 RepID=A0AAV9N6X7_9EURO|nr:hypothetical protein LTR84_005321 [Exophiala bonariae]